MRSLVERRQAMVTALVPLVRHDRAAELEREAARTGRTVREVVLEQGVADAAALDALLDPQELTG